MPFDGTKATFGGAWFTAAEDRDLIEAREAGFSFGDCAVLMGTGRPFQSVSHRHKVLLERGELAEQAAVDAARAAPRKCLKCLCIFNSEHKGNRICSFCRIKVDAVSPIEPLFDLPAGAARRRAAISPLAR